jgi:O-Antigen ligase
LRRLRVAALPTGYAPFPGNWLAPLVVATVVGVIVGSTRSVELLAAITMLLCGWIAAAIMHRATQYAVAVNVLLAVVLPDVLGNVLSFQPVFMLLAANVGVLLVAGHRGPVQREDIGLVFLLAAVLLPYLSGGPLDTLPGALGIVVIMYATGRFRGVSLQSLVALLLMAGAVHGAVAIAQSVPPLSSLVPFEPLRDGLPFLPGRASGLFNNPNGLGSLEAVVLVIAIRVGPRRWMLPLVVLCAAGLILSSSREAVVGLIVGLSLFGIGRLRQMVAWAIVFLIVGVSVVWAFPSLLERLDPSGYAADPNLLGRIDAWRVALDLIGRSPLLGYGTELPKALPFVDNAYLVWLLAGGIVGLVLWIVASTVVTPRLLLPVLAAMLAIAMLANPFSGAVYAVFLSTCGAVAAENARQRPRTPGAAASRVEPPRVTWRPGEVARTFLAPPDLVSRSEHSVAVPLDAWFRGRCDVYRDTVLSREAILQDHLDQQLAASPLGEHLGGAVDYGRRLWLLLSFELGAREWLRGKREVVA